MNRIDEILLQKLNEKMKTNLLIDNSVVLIYKDANRIYVNDEKFDLGKTSDKRILESRLRRLKSSNKIFDFLKLGDKRTYKVFCNLSEKRKFYLNELTRI